MLFIRGDLTAREVSLHFSIGPQQNTISSRVCTTTVTHSIMHFVLSPFRKSWHFEAGMLDVVCLAWNLRVIPFPGVAGPVISPWRQCNRLCTWSWKMEANAAFGLVSPPDWQLLVCLYWPRLLFVSKWRGNLMGRLETRGPSGERSQCTSFERWIDSISQAKSPAESEGQSVNLPHWLERSLAFLASAL